MQADAGSVNSKPNAKAGTSKTKAVVLDLLLSTYETKTKQWSLTLAMLDGEASAETLC